MKLYTPPVYDFLIDRPPAPEKTVFLAGSIDNGEAENWQDTAVTAFRDTDFRVYNPRRPNWNSNCRQSVDNPEFVEQLKWEHHHLHKAEHIIFYFHPESLAPITLMELGMYAERKAHRCVVVCPEPYWRKGNVDFVCKDLRIQQCATLEDALDYVIEEKRFK